MERLDRQRLIEDWDQIRLDTATVCVAVAEKSHPVLVDAFVKGAILIGIGRILLTGRGAGPYVTDLDAYSHAVGSRTHVEFLPAESASVPTLGFEGKPWTIDLGTGLCENRGVLPPNFLAGRINETEFSWFCGDGRSEFLQTGGAVQGSPGHALALAGALLGELVRKIMPLKRWGHSELLAPALFPGNSCPADSQGTRPTVKRNGKTVAVVGVGALGNWFLYGLMHDPFMFDVTRLVLVDDDLIDETNLNRQVLFTGSDIEKSKAEIAAEAFRRRYPWIQVLPVRERIEEETFFNRRNIVPDVLVSCLDSWKARALLNRIAVQNRIPLINGGTDPWSCNVYLYQPDRTSCLDCTLKVEDKSRRETSALSCALVEPSVVFTNMIAGGLMLWTLRHPSSSQRGMMQYDITIPERMGFGGDWCVQGSCGLGCEASSVKRPEPKELCHEA